jgi:SAM-dependent methyltransferase
MGSRDLRDHWETIHREKSATEVSWYRPHLETSLHLIEDATQNKSASIIDVGAGRSTLVDDLLARGYENVTVFDIAQTAIDAARARLGDDAARVRWLVGDVTKTTLSQAAYDVWHDRAVFHFLTDAADRAAYVRQVQSALKPGGCLIIGAFAAGGPARCSGLDVVRYDANALQREFGETLRLTRVIEEEHETPSGRVQPFLYCCFRLEGHPAH